jgi:bifunctional UDP-N-acetylglucosamine pyrophosphorylase / glucosamine-1-phosphate N-acetyltransferase
MDFHAVVLAAGKGTRMKSRTPKVLHELAGRPLVAYVVRAALGAGAHTVTVVCSPDQLMPLRHRLTQEFQDDRVGYAVQPEPRGTGDAARVAIRADSVSHTLILCGDTPLVEAQDLALLGLEETGTLGELRVMSCVLDEPTGYGRIVRGAGESLCAIVEHRDASLEQRAIREVNSGIYLGPTAELLSALEGLSPNNVQGELYLTDAVSWFAKQGRAKVVVGPKEALIGVNDRQELEIVEAALLERIRRRHRRAGVTVEGTARIDDTVTISQDCHIAAGSTLRGQTVLGQGVRVETGSVLDGVVVGDHAIIRPFSVIVDSQVGSSAVVGPFAHLRGSSLVD